MSKQKTVYDSEYRALIDGLARERKRLGLSQCEVSELTHLNQSEISKIENFERRLDILEFKRLLLAYRINGNQSLSFLVKNYLNLEI